jgi:hypothetical protein
MKIQEKNLLLSDTVIAMLLPVLLLDKFVIF